MNNMNNRFEFDTYDFEFNDIKRDIEKLRKIGTILSIEIDLDPTSLLSADTLRFCERHDAIYHFFDSVYIKTDLIDHHTLLYFLKMIVNDTESIINDIIIQSSIKLRSGEITFNVSLNSETDLPMLLSVSDEAKFFNFMQSFRFLWASS